MNNIIYHGPGHSEEENEIATRLANMHNDFPSLIHSWSRPFHLLASPVIINKDSSITINLCHDELIACARNFATQMMHTEIRLMGEIDKIKEIKNRLEEIEPILKDIGINEIEKAIQALSAKNDIIWEKTNKLSKGEIMLLGAQVDIGDAFTAIKQAVPQFSIAVETAFANVTSAKNNAYTPSQPVAKLSVFTTVRLAAQKIFDNIKKVAKKIVNKVKVAFSKIANASDKNGTADIKTDSRLTEEDRMDAKINGEYTAGAIKIKKEAERIAEPSGITAGLVVFGACAGVGFVVGNILLPVIGGAIGLAIGSVIGSGLRKIISRFVTNKFTMWYTKSRLMALKRELAISAGDSKEAAENKAREEGERYEETEKTKQIGILDGGLANLLLNSILQGLANLLLNIFTGGLDTIGETILILMEIAISITTTAAGDCLEKFISCTKAIKDCENLKERITNSSLRLKIAEKDIEEIYS
jgi:hypothetical protein